MNLSADKEESFLRSLEYGCGVMYTLTARDARKASSTKDNALYNTDAATWKDDVVESYKKAEKVYSVVGGNIKGHSRLADGVFKSDFENGSLIINYTGQPFVYGGVTVEPKGYFALSGGGKQ